MMNFCTKNFLIPPLEKFCRGLKILNAIDKAAVYDAIVVAVAHKEFLTFDYLKYRRNNGVIFDTKSCVDRSLVDARL